MSKIILFAGNLILIFILAGCSAEKEVLTFPDNDKLSFFHYEYENDKEILKSDIINLQKDADLEEALESILKITSDYYSKNSNEAGVISFQLKDINIIKTENKAYRIAVINILDNANTMERKYFQGSTGGMITQNTILLNVLQPQIEGFLDGTILLINDNPIYEMDHLDLRGIKVPGNLSYLAAQGLK